MKTFFVSTNGETLDNLLNKTGDAVCVTNKDMVFLGANLNFAKFYGLESPSQMLGKTAIEMYPDFKKSVFYDACARTASTGETTTRYGYSMAQKKWVVIRCYKIEDDQFAMVVHDVTDSTNKAGYVSQIDTLTSLPNRWAFESDTNKIDNLSDFSLTIIDISHFKDFNDKVGFSAGDRCLMEVGARIRQHSLRADRVYRIGNDQFLILGPNDQSAAEYRRQNLLPLLVEPMKIGSKEYVLQFNVGVTVCDQSSSITDSLIHAETALSIAKKNKQGYVVYSEAMNGSSVYDPVMIKTIRDAIANDEFVAYFQPQVDLIDNTTCSAEALIRWHKDGKVIPPFQFLPFAEESGLITELDRVVARKTFEQLQYLQEKGIYLPISLNLSANSLCDLTTVEFFQQLLEEIPVVPQRVGIEITETSFMRDLDASQRVIEDLKRLGFHISIDDFGTGYSSMSYLLRYPSNYLKIDREFVTNITKEKNHQVIVKNIIGLAHGMHIGVVAEGVESIEDMQKLKEFGCDIAQGYYISKPIPSEEFLLWVETHPLGDLGGDIL